MNFVIAGPDIQPLGEIAALTDQLRVPRDLFDRQEGAARDGVAAEQSERGEKRQEPERQTDNVIKHVDAFVLRDDPAQRQTVRTGQVQALYTDIIGSAVMLYLRDSLGRVLFGREGKANRSAAVEQIAVRIIERGIDALVDVAEVIVDSEPAVLIGKKLITVADVLVI